MRRGGEGAERADEHRAIARRNGERIAAEAGDRTGGLDASACDLHPPGPGAADPPAFGRGEQFTALMATVEASPEMVRLGADDRVAERFTTRAMIATEARMERAAAALGEGRGHGVDASVQADALASRGLGDEQAAAFRHVTGSSDLALVVGYAGTGKSTMLGAAREAWAASGYTVRGATLSGSRPRGWRRGRGLRRARSPRWSMAGARGETHSHRATSW